MEALTVRPRHQDPEVLAGLLARGLSLREIAEELGVSFTCVRRWINRHGLGPTARSRRIEAVRAARAAGSSEIELTCPTHGATAFKILSGSRVRCKRCNSEAVARRRRRVKGILEEEAGGRCILCGYDRHPSALEFHHLDPARKAFAISKAGITRSLAASREEAKKCVLLCANCHAEVEVGAANLPVQ